MSERTWVFWVLDFKLSSQFSTMKILQIIENYNVTESVLSQETPTVLWSVLVSTLVTSHSSQFGLIWASMVPSETRVKHRVTEAG